MRQNTIAEQITETSKNRDKNLRLFFYSGWFLLAILQAYFTQIQDDESYYWVYSKYLDWGYFDHPPMIALLVKMGTVIFPKELGIRLLPAILSTLTIFITEQLLRNKNLRLFYAICLSVAVLQLSGFWAVPDVPLMFFTALFFLFYRNFVDRTNWANTILVALAIACLFYSKYHGVLVVGFAILADLTVLKKWKIYIVGILALIFFLPHLYWQYQHDWITFRFQLFENKAHPYQVNFTLDYLFGQLVIAGPLVGVFLLYSTFAYKPKVVIETILKVNAIGILLFFLLSTLRGQVEANWTSPAIVPMLVLTHNYLLEHTQWRKWLFRLFPYSLAIVFFARVLMVFDILPIPAIVEKFHSWKHWPKELEQKTEGLPVVFSNSYQRASMYWFHTGKMAYSLNSFDQRRNNYSYWPIENNLLGKTVYRVDIYDINTYQDSIQATLWKVGFTKDTNYRSFAKVEIKPAKESYTVKHGQTLSVDFSTIFPKQYFEYLVAHPTVNEKIKFVVYQKQDVVKVIDCPFTLRDLVRKPVQNLSAVLDLPVHRYDFIFSIGSADRWFTHNSYRTKLVVE
jgi:hypothetical protein